MFSDEFCTTKLRHIFTEHVQATASVLPKKYFTNKIVKNTLTKEQKMETACKKNKDTPKTKLNHYLHQVFISFYY